VSAALDQYTLLSEASLEVPFVEKRLLLLKLVLDELGVPVDPSSLDSRKSMQKAVYLAQAMNVPLGYRFNWYVMGPYSPMLTEDYYNPTLQSAEDGEAALRSDIKARLKQLQVLIDSPSGEGIPRTDWLELLASWHYLRSAQ
jgi:uncharacterized protein YwgA